MKRNIEETETQELELIKNKKLNTKGSKLRNQNVVDRFVKYDQEYKHKMEKRKRQEADEENK